MISPFTPGGSASRSAYVAGFVWRAALLMGRILREMRGERQQARESRDGRGCRDRRTSSEVDGARGKVVTIEKAR
jgi:hypothetical protein